MAVNSGNPIAPGGLRPGDEKTRETESLVAVLHERVAMTGDRLKGHVLVRSLVMG